MRTINQKTYSELCSFETFRDRFEYLNLNGRIGDLTHGEFRYLNQAFYSSTEWRQFRNAIIERDDGLDLGVPGHEIHGQIIVHHIVPITVAMLDDHDPLIMDPNNVICVSRQTHDAIHYGSYATAPQDFEPRRPGDTTLWKRGTHG